MPRKPILERLTEGPPIVADGSTGAVLMQWGLDAGEPPERWVLEKPDNIRKLQTGYAEAGSEMLLSCTFGATRPRMERHELGDRLDEVCERAVELAREVAGNDRYVAGDIGPLGEFLQPLGTLSFDDAVEIFAEQTAAMVRGEVDLILVETMTDLNEMKAAIAGARQVTDLPVFASFSFDAGGRTMMGLSPQQAAEALLELEVAALGANCGKSLEDNIAAVRAMREAAPNAPLIAKPNAGLPRLVDGRTVFDTTPAEMAEAAREFVRLGARVIGGCCGNGHDHIRAIAEAVRQASAQ
jgi:5-methyltetrahydrofolate--homocysteine methyltransferase